MLSVRALFSRQSGGVALRALQLPVSSHNERRSASSHAAAVSAGKKALAALALSPAKPPLVGAAAVSFLQFAPPIVCQALWAAPYPTIKEAEKKGSTEGLPPLGYFSMFANGYLWMAYGYTAGMDPTIMLPNMTGMMAGAYYTSKFIKYDSGAFNLAPYKAGTAAAIVGVTSVVATQDVATAQQILGYGGCAIVVAMFSGPLQVIKEVIDTKSTKNLPFPMAIATVANCTLWASYGGLVIHDPFIWGPNVLGLASGVTQLGLFAKYGIHKAEPVPDLASAATDSVPDGEQSKKHA